MKISGDVPKITPVYGGAKRVGQAYGMSGVSAKRDELTISGTAKDFQTVMKALKDVPDVRDEKVAEIGSQVDAGTYEVGSEDVSSKIIESLMSRRI